MVGLIFFFGEGGERMAQAGSAFVKILADDSQARKTINGFFGFLQKSGSIAAGVVGGLAVFETIQSTFSGLGQATIGANADMETYQNTLATVLKSSEKATKMLAWANKFAAETPFEIPDIVEATTKLETYGISAKGTLGDIGDMAAVTGKPLMQAVEAIADAQTGELERLKEFGITKQMLIDQADKMGMDPVVNKKGQIIDQENFNKALFKLMEDRYKGGMALQAKTFKGMVSNAKDVMGTIAREMSKPIFEKFKDGLRSILPVANALVSFVRGDLVGSSKTLKEAFGPEMGNQIFNAFEIVKKGATMAKDAFFDMQPTLVNLWGIFKDIAPTVGVVLAGAFKALTTYIPPLVNGLTSIVKSITGWEGFIPVVTGLVSAFVTYKAIMLAIAVQQAKVNAITKISIALSKAQRAAHLAMVISGGGVKGALLAMRAAMRSLNLTMLANPIVLVVSLLAGLGVALVVAYKKSETFRNIVNGAWKSIKDGFGATIKWCNTEIPKWVKGAVSWFNGLKDDYTKISDSIKKKVLEILLSMINTYIEYMTNMQKYVEGILKIIKGVFTGDFNLIKKGVSESTQALYDQVKLILGKLGINVDEQVEKIKNFFINGWKSIKSNTSEIFKSIYNNISGNIGNIVTAAKNMPGRLGSAIREKASSATSAMSSMAGSMKDKLTDKITDIKNAAAGIPGKIGSAIRNKVSSATSAMSDLAKSLITKFKKALGINSPSKVFYEMAGHIISGLVNGLSAGNLKNLGKKTFKDFAGGAFNSLTSIKDWVKGGFSLGKVGGNVTSWIKQAMALTKTDASWLQPLSTMAMKESGGRTGPSTINKWDSNWKRGTPSMGLFQTIKPTFDFFKMKGLDDIMNPVHNAVAAIRYIKSRYGTVFNTPGIKSMMHGGPYKGYEFGGFVKQRQLAWLAENNKPEAIVPLVGNRMDPFAVAVAAKLGSIFERNTSSANGGFTVHTEFHQSEPLPPSEIKRKQLQLARQLANEWGFGG